MKDAFGIFKNIFINVYVRLFQKLLKFTVEKTDYIDVVYRRCMQCTMQ